MYIYTSNASVCVDIHVFRHILCGLVHMLQAGARALILSPTRELAAQTMKFTKEVT